MRGQVVMRGRKPAMRPVRPILQLTEEQVQQYQREKEQREKELKQYQQEQEIRRKNYQQQQKENENILKIKKERLELEEKNIEIQNDIKMQGQKRWRFIASENDHFPNTISIGAELRYGSGDKWFYKNMTEDMKEKRNMTSHDALGVDHDVAPGVVKQLEIHEKYTGSKWVPITEPELILKARGRKTRRNRNLKKRKITRKH